MPSSRLRTTASRSPVATVVLAAAFLGLAACGTDAATSANAPQQAPPADAPAPDGTMTGGTTTADHGTQDHAGQRHDPSGHAHEMVATDRDMAVSLTVQPDAKAGWNVHVEATGFTWAPEHASGEAVDGEGHAHLYVDGEKVGRLYGEWFHLVRDLAPGEHELRVTLNANDHRDYAVDGAVVEAVATFGVPTT